MSSVLTCQSQGANQDSKSVFCQADSEGCAVSKSVEIGCACHWILQGYYFDLCIENYAYFASVSKTAEWVPFLHSLKRFDRLSIYLRHSCPNTITNFAFPGFSVSRDQSTRSSS